MRRRLRPILVAVFYRGPFDGKRVILPTDEPWPRFVIPKFGTIQIEYYYLLAGPLEENLYSYLFDDSFSPVMGDVTRTS